VRKTNEVGDGTLILERVYLSVYNFVQWIAWVCVWCMTLRSFAIHASVFEVYADVGWLVAACQRLAVLELVHCAVGLAGGSPMAAFVQLAGRNACFFLVVRHDHEAQKLVFPLFLVWATIEIIRYPFYVVVTLAGKAPNWLTRLRYNAFIPLYPAGMLCEMRCYFVALPAIRLRRLFYFLTSFSLGSALPQLRLEFNFARFVQALLLAYLFVGPLQYSYMFHQRRKRIADLKTAARSKTSWSRQILAFMAGLISAFIAVGFGEIVGHLVAPPPTNESGEVHMANLTFLHYFGVIVAGSFGATVGGMVSRSWSEDIQPTVAVATLLLLSMIANLLIIPGPTWFWVVTLLQVFPFALFGRYLSSGQPS